MQPISEALKIQGWTTRTELEALRSIAMSMPPRAQVCEIGPWQGRSTVALAVDHINLTCVDTFQGTPGEGCAYAARSKNIYSIFSANMRRLGLAPGVMQMDALEAASLVPDNSLDGVYQDGDHGETFRAHFWAWFWKLKRGATYFGHDFHRVWHPTVPLVLKESGFVIHVIPRTTIWAFRKP